MPSQENTFFFVCECPFIDYLAALDLSCSTRGPSLQCMDSSCSTQAPEHEASVVVACGLNDLVAPQHVRP